MKILHTLLIVIILALIGFFFFSTKPKEVVAPTTVPAAEQVIEETVAPSDEGPEHGMTAEEAAALVGESEKGSDIGMEMPTPDMPIDSLTKTFEVTAEDFAYSLSEIRVDEGDTVIIKFKSVEGFHDFVIDEFDVRTPKVKTGGESEIIFLANKKGTFEYYCSVGSHRANGMVGNLIVE